MVPAVPRRPLLAALALLLLSVVLVPAPAGGAASRADAPQAVTAAVGRAADVAVVLRWRHPGARAFRVQRCAGRAAAARCSVARVAARRTPDRSARPAARWRWVDRSARPGHAYAYRVAVRVGGRWSAWSRPARVRLPRRGAASPEPRLVARPVTTAPPTAPAAPAGSEPAPEAPEAASPAPGAPEAAAPAPGVPVPAPASPAPDATDPPPPDPSPTAPPANEDLAGDPFPGDDLPGAVAAPTGAQVQAWLTSADGTRLLARAADAELGAASGDAAADAGTVVVDVRERHQAMLGFGASITDSSAHLIAALPAGQRARLLRALFSPTAGIGLDYLRQPIGATDFMAGPLLPAYEREGRFDVAHDAQQILPLLREALALNGDVRVMATPWSAPASMKDVGVLRGGSLLPGSRDAYAAYLVSALLAYRDAGVPIADMTPQNEPQLASSYATMVMTPAEQAAFVRVLDEHLTAAGLDTRLFAYDHNWDDPGYALDVLRAAPDVARLEGAAFHCYAGEPEATGVVRAAGARVLQTECSGSDSGDPDRTFADTLAWQAERLLIRGPRSGAETAVTWNVALDAAGGPHVGECGTRCNGVVEIAGGGWRANAEYYVLGHASPFVARGARRIGSAGGDGGLLHVAFRNPDGGRVLIAFNTGDEARSLRVVDGAAASSQGEGARAFAGSVPARSLATFRWAGDAADDTRGVLLDRGAWRATASALPSDPCCVADLPARALDGDPATRWTTGVAQAPGQWLALDLGAARSFDAIELDSGAGGDHPRSLAVEVSDDGRDWSAPVAVATGTGRLLTVELPPTTTRWVRLVQTGAAGNWWSVHELNLVDR